jgi:hypothetical protein
MYKAFISYSHSGDSRLAPALQKALEGFAKPWYKLRNLNIFRDEGSLAVNPKLWSNIQAALDKSEYLIYMASPTSASSKWVNKEVEYWIMNKSIDSLFIALTEGNITWEEENKIFINKGLNALPPVLINKFTEEPFYIDLRHIRSENDLSLQNPGFKKEVLKLAAALHGKEPKDLAGEDISAHRRMIRIRNAAIGALVLLLVAITGAGWFANIKRIEANDKTILAENNAAEAKSNLKKLKQEEFERYYKNGNTYLEAEEYCLARDCFTKAQLTAMDTTFNSGISAARIRYLDSAIVVCTVKSSCK